MSARDDYPVRTSLPVAVDQWGEMCDEIDQLRANLDAAVLDADLQRESYMAADARERGAMVEAAARGDRLFHLARLARSGDRRDVDLYVHRLAIKYRGTTLGDALAEIDPLPGVALREQP